MSLLSNSYGSPFVKIFTDTLDVSANVSKFDYKYSEEDDDVCQILIEELDVKLADRKEFQEGNEIFVSWGYLNTKKVKTRKVVIREVVATYSHETISLELLCTDKFGLTKVNSSKHIWKTADINVVASSIAKKYNLDFAGVNALGNNQEVIERTGERVPTYFKNDGNYTTAIDNTANPIQLNFTLHDDYPQANKSDFQLLTDMVNKEPGGPWRVVGRDGKLIIERIPLNKRPIASYTYIKGKGDLLKFVPETKNRRKKGSALHLTVNSFDPLNKKPIEDSVDTTTKTTVPKLGDKIEINGKGLFISGKNAGELQISTINFVLRTDTQLKSDKNNINPGRILQNQLGTTPDGQSKILSFLGIDRIDDTGLSTNQMVKLANEKAIITSELQGPDNPYLYPDAIKNNQKLIASVKKNTEAISSNLNYNKNLQSEEDEAERAFGHALNRQHMAELDKQPGDLETVGDPMLESGELVTILNVANKHMGNWYITECTHSLSKHKPYECKSKIKRNAHNGLAVLNTHTTEARVKDVSVNKTNREVGPEILDPNNSVLQQVKNLPANSPIQKPIVTNTGDRS